MKQGFLLIDGCKNAVILSMDEVKAAGLDELLGKHDVMAKVRRNSNMKELDATVRDYLKGGWEDIKEMKCSYCGRMTDERCRNCDRYKELLKVGEDNDIQG